MLNQAKLLKNRLRKSKDAKTLISNFAYLLILQISNYVLPLLTIPYLARVIGVEGFGKIAFAAAVIVWFQTIAYWGFNYTATRDVARNKENINKVSEIFSNVLWARLLLMTVSILILLFMIITIPYFKENRNILLVTFLTVPGSIFFPDWFFQAMEKMKYITILNVFSKLLFTALVFIFIKEKSDYILQPLFISFGYILPAVFSIYIIRFKWKVKILPPNIHSIKASIKNSADIFINSIMPNLYNSFSTVLLGVYGGSASNGILDAGSKFVNISQSFLMIITRVFFPLFSRKLDKHNLYVKISLLASLLFSIALFFLSPLIIKIFFTTEFYQSISVLKIMSLSIFFTALINIYGVNYMIIKGYEKDLRNITIISSLIGFLLSFPLIYCYDFIGAAITITLTRCILGISIMLKAKGLKKSLRSVK